MAGKPVIIATQMLEFDGASPTPTRAEASDVATAIYDGADAVMLSAESASGDYPVEAVAMMDRIIRTPSDTRCTARSSTLRSPARKEPRHTQCRPRPPRLPAAIHASAMVAFTSSGNTAARIARKRPSVPILAVTPNQTVSRQLCLLWGAHSVLSKDVNSYEEMVDRATRTALAEEFAKPAEPIVVVAGIPFGEAGTTNNLRVVQIAG